MSNEDKIEDERWTWDHEFEDAGRPGHHYTRNTGDIVLIVGDGENDYYRLENCPPQHARVIARAPEMFGALKETVRLLGDFNTQLTEGEIKHYEKLCDIIEYVEGE